ncbi:MAG: hypothetical protein HZC48_01030 [Nitrospirae bacterium]|nr:hypothetical protein [Nitrospirota bacterium]
MIASNINMRAITKIKIRHIIMGTDKYVNKKPEPTNFICYPILLSDKTSVAKDGIKWKNTRLRKPPLF